MNYLPIMLLWGNHSEFHYWIIIEAYDIADGCRWPEADWLPATIQIFRLFEPISFFFFFSSSRGDNSNDQWYFLFASRKITKILICQKILIPGTIL